MSPLRAITLRVIGPGLMILIGVGCGTAFPITNQEKTHWWDTGTDPTQGRTQSETSIASGSGAYEGHCTVTYNDETYTEQTILYTSTNRTVKSGASLMGWSYTTDSGQTWHYGGKVATTPEWPVLWGDPAIITSISDPRYVFLSNLAVPVGKYPPGGISGQLTGASPIGGACIARSTDGGVTFSMYQCLHTPTFDFYDGGSMESSLRGEIFVAYTNVPHDRIDVWRSPAPDGQFAPLPDPFPGLLIVGHPRLRVARETGDLYAMVADSFGILYINRFTNGAWQQPRVVWFDYVNMGVQFSDRYLRSGVEFSFDIGQPVTEDGRDAIRVLYTASGSRDGRLHIAGSMCRADLRENCNLAPGWGTDLPGDQFNPNVRAWRFATDLVASWKATFVSRDTDPDGNTVLVRIGELVIQSNGLHGFPQRKLLDPQLLCPDNRGYWGDYNDLQHFGSKWFLYTFSDSRAGCTNRSKFTSTALHVLGVVE